ncbi:MAG: tolB protein precursor, periplasmic protein involved in the tonb-independent uptake of group A colicins [uncultured Sulfurovum sp.]|uniref:TolB protein, periplasmic protein involved in the tonb-independent uptake of group A colicins n=1 Tax=uncultured Sulfurovum sp. TaxID=269237 RepID=A0A6S6SEE8_9BACT|nr:MAG: tolB protein precursor, periplasmic protein involved in the tonb-independent uptake of group A colicins [uncultured Sulfurovum sp.]
MLFLSLNLFAVDATMKIEKDVEQRSRVALVDGSLTPNSNFFKILLSDLKISGHFLSDSVHHKGDVNSNFISPSLKGREYILKYSLTQAQETTLFVRLLKSADGSEMFQKKYAIPHANKTPFLAHKVVSDINSALNYPDISWINRYVIFSRYTTPGRSEIVLADYTFNYQKVIIKGGLNLFPHWADAEQKSFYYSAYGGLMPTLYKINIYTGAKEKIAVSQGMLVCSDVSKDGSKLLLTMAPEGQADIFEFDVATKSKKQITRFRGIDVSGKYVDNESRIVFVSNRLGYANIFKKAIHSSAISQVVYHGRNNNACDAHDGKIVYTSRESKNSFGSNVFNLYLTQSGSSTARPLTSTGANQFPRFSTDGSVLLYLKQHGQRTSIGYTNLNSHQSLLFPFSGKKIQSIDW